MPPIFSRAAITLGVGPHSSIVIKYSDTLRCLACGLFPGTRQFFWCHTSWSHFEPVFFGRFCRRWYPAIHSEHLPGTVILAAWRRRCLLLWTAVHCVTYCSTHCHLLLHSGYLLSCLNLHGLRTNTKFLELGHSYIYLSKHWIRFYILRWTMVIAEKWWCCLFWFVLEYYFCKWFIFIYLL